MNTYVVGGLTWIIVLKRRVVLVLPPPSLWCSAKSSVDCCLVRREWMKGVTLHPSLYKLPARVESDDRAVWNYLHWHGTMSFWQPCLLFLSSSLDSSLLAWKVPSIHPPAFPCIGVCKTLVRARTSGRGTFDSLKRVPSTGRSDVTFYCTVCVVEVMQTNMGSVCDWLRKVRELGAKVLTW